MVAHSAALRVCKSWLTDAERERHAAFVGTLETPIWADYISEDAE
ncbi:hypothetical protein [Methylobacterium mesophilicum]|nr:hypothetical protein [Methylobacterium mesophilicum]